MAAFFLAFLLTLILDQASRSQAMAARLPEGRITAAGLVLAVTVTSGGAALAGACIAPLLVPEARLLFLAIAILFGGVGQIVAAARPRSILPNTVTSRVSGLVRITVRRASENAVFATAGIAAYTGSPVLAGTGALLGGLAALLPAPMMGVDFVRRSPPRMFLVLSGMLLTCTAILLLAAALRLL